MTQKLLFWLVLCSVLLTGCGSSTPPTSVHQPMSARPVDRVITPPADGSIFHAGINYRPLFEDKRARNVGDILTIAIAENISGNRSNSATREYSNSIDANLPSVETNIGSALISKIPIIGSPAARLLDDLFSISGSVSGSSSNSNERTADGSASNDLTGTIAVTVIEVLPNGNLLVSGEKQVALNHSHEFIRFSGVVNPTTITSENSVPSTQVADARIEYKDAGAMHELKNDAQSLGFLARFFLSVMPF